MEYQAKEGGFLYFTLDDEKQYQVHQETVQKPISVKGGTLQGRQIPEEPLYMILNVDMSVRWGWPSCNESLLRETDPEASCCVDCRNATCTKYQPHLETLCKVLDEPTYYDIDYVRIWQRPNKTSLDCSPAAMPTRGWIESHAARYNTEVGSEPLKPIFAGGKKCSSHADCGGYLIAPRGGTCNNGVCQCRSDSTGPRCLARRIGSAAVCKPLEETIVGGASCFTTDRYLQSSQEAASDCGVAEGRGQCVLIKRGGEIPPFFFDHLAIELDMDGGSLAPGGGGNGRCQCTDGWGGAACDRRIQGTSIAACNPEDSCIKARGGCPSAGWAGVLESEGSLENYTTLASYIDAVCTSPNPTTELQTACAEARWTPEGPATYAQCGLWARALHVAKAASCGVSDSNGENSKHNSFAAYGSIAGTLVATLILCSLCLYCCRPRKQATKPPLPIVKPTMTIEP